MSETCTVDLKWHICSTWNISDDIVENLIIYIYIYIIFLRSPLCFTKFPGKRRTWSSSSRNFSRTRLWKICGPRAKPGWREFNLGRRPCLEHLAKKERPAGQEAKARQASKKKVDASYSGWKKSWADRIGGLSSLRIYRVSTIQGGAGFLPSLRGFCLGIGGSSTAKASF